MSPPSSRGAYSCLELQRLQSMYDELVQWRINPAIHTMEEERAEGRILGFVKGLRLSAQLIYALREACHRPDIEINWGHLVQGDMSVLSRECDVIIHYPEGRIRRWNGGYSPHVMDFHFVRAESALAVISCKSFLRRSGVDRSYCKCLRPFVKKVLLFAECCRPDESNAIRRSATRAGYAGFWTLYKWKDDDQAVTKDENEWHSFLRTVERFLPAPRRAAGRSRRKGK